MIVTVQRVCQKDIFRTSLSRSEVVSLTKAQNRTAASVINKFSQEHYKILLISVIIKLCELALHLGVLICEERGRLFSQAKEILIIRDTHPRQSRPRALLCM